MLRFGPLSTRYKDVFDIYYLIGFVDKERLLDYMRLDIIKDKDMRESSIDDVRKRIRQTFSNRLYRANIKRAGRANWLQIKPAIAFAGIEEFLASLEKYE